MSGKVYCPQCFIRFYPNRAKSAKRQRDEHLKNFHVREGEVLRPAPRPTDEQAKPDGYCDVKCAACGEIVREPYWNTSQVGGSEKDEASRNAGDPVRVSKFWTKRKVEIEIHTWVGMGAFAQHYYFKLEEADDYPIILEPEYGKGTLRAVVYKSQPWSDPHRGRRVEDERNLFTREDAMKRAVEKYLEVFDCKTHYLVHHYSHDTEDRELVRKLLRSFREGD